MIKEFYTKALPESGVYCIATIDPIVKLVKHKFVENLVDLETFINEKRDTGLNIFVALSSFSGYSRKADEAKFVRSFFVDLDVGEGKGYDSKESALKAADQFILENNLPPPVKIDSGTGIHLYWLFDRDIPAAEWKPYAEKFKDYCISRGLNIDPVVTADLARILRCPDTFNHKTMPPTPTLVISEDIPIYVFDEIKEFLGEVEPTLESILQSVPKGLSEDQRKALKLDNFESNFGKLVEDSEEGKGCAQIVFIMDNVKTLQEPLWYSGLSIAQHCADKDAAIHLISKDYPNYDEKETIRKAQATQGKPHSCDTFNNVNPGICDGCPHRGKITNPLALGKIFKIAVAEESTPIEQIIPANALEVVKENTVLKRGLNSLPEELFPYVYGIHGGIYWTPPDKFEEGKAVSQQPILVSLYDLYPLKRIYSPTDGDCLLMKAVLPRDPEREFILPMRFVYASEKLREIISSQGVLINPDPKGTQLMMNYIIKWGHYLMTKNAAEIMRMQMGWTDNHESFVVGETEIMKDGQEISSPTSPLCRGIAKHLNTAGSFNDWKIAAEKLNKDSLELHAFTLLTGFGSILMNYTSTSGVTVCLTGESGAAKTGALYSCLSVWGNPKDLSVLDATENGMTGRYLGLHNIPFGLDEVGNMLPKTLSQLIHKISQGKSKIRMQASVNAERDHEMSASLIAVFTSNHSLYDKLTILKKDPNGEVARLIEFAVRKPQAFNDDPTLGKEIFDKFRFNYGWAGREFIRVLFKYTDDDIKGMMDKWVDRFRKDFGEDTAYRFYENLIAASLTGGQIAAKAGIVQYDLDKVYKKIVGEMVAIRDNVVKVNAIDYEALIGEFINMHQTGILAFKDGKTSMEPRSPLVIRAEVDSSLIFISKPEFRKFLSENMVSSREFVFQMQQAGIDVKEARKRMGTGWKDATGTINTETYVFNTTKLSERALKGMNEPA
jgi:hypothetical protein